jgi:membrane fusion protein, heavy metal efflux system
MVTRIPQCSPLSAFIRQASLTFLSLMVLTTSTAPVLAHAGHGDHEFQGGSQAPPSATQIQVDDDTAQRMGLTVEPVTERRLAFRIKATGQIETLPNQQVEVTTPVGGTVTQLLVKPGERVQAGQAVAFMSSPELAQLRTEALDREAEALADGQQAQADLRLAHQIYAQQQKIAGADINQARVALSFAQERYTRDQELLASGAIPRRQFLESETQLAEARAALAKADSRLQVSEAQAQLKRAQSALQVAQSKLHLSGKTYQTRLQQLGASPNLNGTITLKAPIAGIVSDREVTLGQSGQDAGLNVMTIIDGRRVQVTANIYEKDLHQIKVGQQVQVKINGLSDRTFQGYISVIGAIVAGETRVVPVRAELDNVDAVLKPGMFAELEVLTNQTTASVLAVPTTAIVETNDKKQLVFVQNGNAYEPVEVTLGQASGEFVEVKSGVFDGDLVVTQRANQLYAQSLRGGGSQEPTVAAKPLSEKPQASPATGILLNLVNQPVSWWTVVSVGGAISAGTFFAGTYWANHRHRRQLATATDGEDYGSDSSEQGYSHNGLTAFSSAAYKVKTSQPPAVQDTQKQPTQDH